MPVGRGAPWLGAVLLVSAGCPNPIPVLPPGAGSDSSSSGVGGNEASDTSAPSDTTAAPTSTTGSTGFDSSSTTGSSTGLGSTDDDSSSSGADAQCELRQACAGGVPWWDQGWPYRMGVRIDSPFAAPLTDVVVAVHFDEDFEFACSIETAEDLRFVDTDGSRLDHEIDEWTPGEGGLAWVRLPVLEPSGHDVLLYFGNPTPPDDPVDVWPEAAGYRAVLHFGQDLEDSAGNHPGQTAGPDAPLYLADDVLGSAIHFEDILVDRRVELENSATLDDAFIASEAFTVTAWARPNPDVASSSQVRSIVGRGAEQWGLSVVDASGGFDFLPPVNANFFSHCALPPAECDRSVNFGGNHFLLGTSSVVDDDVISVWHHTAIVFETAGPGLDTKRVYVDGVLEAEFTGNVPMPFDELGLHDVPVTIGADPNIETTAFHGELDEVHIIDQAWSSDRVRAEYELARGPQLGASWVDVQPASACTDGS